MDRPATRREHHDAARSRLRRTVLAGLLSVQTIGGILGTVLALLDPAKDPAIISVFLPDILMSLVVVWVVFLRRGLDLGIRIYAIYMAVNYALFALHADGLRVFVSPWALIPPICGFYLGGRRLGLWLTAVIVGEGLCALLVQALGTGHHFIDIPPPTDANMQFMLAVSVIEILTVVGTFEWARAREEGMLAEALRAADEQSEIVTSLVENVSDPILLLDGDHRVVARNGAAATAFPQLSAGSSFLGVVPPARVRPWQRWLDEAAASGNAQAEEPLETAAGPRPFECSCSRVATGGRMVGFTLVARDLMRRREAEASMRKMRGQLLDASRRAGMAEVAASLLHEAGNSLNGAVVSTAKLREGVMALKVDGVRRAAGLLRDKAPELGAALGAKGAQIIDFMDVLANHLDAQRAALALEASELDEQIARVAHTLAAQSERARVREVYEEVDPVELVTSALAADEEAWREVNLLTELDPVGPIVTVRPKLQQIMLSLLAQARASGRSVHLTLRLAAGERVALALGQGASTGRDLFSPGGPLHAAALAATELGGSLGRRDGRIVLELPRSAQPEVARPS